MKKVLYIDDEVETEQMASKFDLMAREGIQAIKVANIDEALPTIERHKNDLGLVVLDVIIPPEDYYRMEETNGGTTTGLRLLKDIRKTYHDIPVIIVSVRRVEAPEEIMNRYNVRKYLPKPITAADLVSAIKEVLNEG